MQGPINIKAPNNTSKWQMGFNSAFKGLKAGDLKHWNKFQWDICVDPKHINKYVITDRQVCKKHRKSSETQQLFISAVI
jgi:hypothetical protein